MTTQPSDWAVARAFEHWRTLPHSDGEDFAEYRSMTEDFIIERARELDASGGGDPCRCGESTCTEPWEPGCGLGASAEHAVIASDDFSRGWKAGYGYRDKATPRAAEAGEWLPIESAPRDGTRIILGRPDEDGDGGGISVCGYWIDELEDGVDYMGNDGGFTDVDYQVFQPGRSFGAESYRCAGKQPTHWRPLPAPPQAAMGAVGAPLTRPRKGEVTDE
jgi:hypothetical protein